MDNKYLALMYKCKHVVTFSLPGCPSYNNRALLAALEVVTTDLNSLNLGGDTFSDEVDSVLLHVLSNLTGHLMIKPTEQDTPDHDRGIATHSVQEASALQSNVAGAHKQGRAGVVRQTVICGY